MARWLFLRHGESVANAERWYAGQVDSPLTDRGRAQAQHARAAVADCGAARALVSDLSRARETAAIVLAERPLPIAFHAELRERSCGSWERRTIDSMRADGHFEQFYLWDWRPPGGESLRDVTHRVAGFLATMDDGCDTLVVCHGAVMRAVIGFLDGRPTGEIGRWRPENCQLVEREVPLGGWAALAARCAPH